jgi:hypothetical protein
VSLHPRQEGFGAGEISDRLRSRVSLPIYQKALRLARNFLIDAEGNATNRPGFQLDHETKLSGASKSVVRKFIFGGGQNYVLEFGVNYIRFHQDGAMIESSPGVALQVVTTYAEADLPQIKLTQSGDVVYIFCGNKTIKVLTRVAHTNWTFVDFAPTAGVNPPTALALLVGATDADAQHVGKSWDILVTSISGGDTPEESLVSNLLNIPNTKALYPDRPAFYTWVAPAAGAAPVRYAVYRATGGSGRYGFIGESNSNVFRDDGQVPLYAEPPPSGRNPFAGGAANNPQTGTFHSQRLWAANSIPAPNTIWSTRLAAFKSFDAASPPKDDDAITLTLATREFDEIRSMLSLVNLLAFGSGAEWILTGVQGAPPTPNSPVPRSRSAIGARAGSTRSSRATRRSSSPTPTATSASWSSRARGRQSRERRQRSLDASRCTSSRSTPSSTPVSRVRPTGRDSTCATTAFVLALSYIKQQQQVAWSQFDTTDGFFESVCSIPEGVEDAVYGVVKRTVNGVTKRYVERLATRQISSARWGVFSDGSVFFNGENTDPTLTFTVTGVYTVGGAVNIVASAAAFQAGDVGDNIVLMPAEMAATSASRSPALPTRRTSPGSCSTRCPLRSRPSRPPTGLSADRTFPGLDHLNGVVVDVIADGVPVDPSPARRGRAVLPGEPGRLRRDRAALRRGSRPARPARGAQQGEARQPRDLRGGGHRDPRHPGRARRSSSLSDWFPLPEVVADPVSLMALDPITGDQQAQVSIQIDSTWNPGGAAYLRQSKPLPITVKAAIREVTIAPD